MGFRASLVRASAIAIAMLVACSGGEDDCPDGTCPPPTTAPADDGSGGGSGSGDDSDDDGGDAASSGEGSSGDSTGAGPSAGDDDGMGATTGPTDANACDPQSAQFEGDPEMASVTLDFDAMTCAVSGGAPESAQLVLNVQMSGQVTATGYGLEIESSNVGLLFSDPVEGDSQVIDLSPDIPIIFGATLVADGRPVTIELTIFSTGPTLTDVTAVFG